MASVYIAYIMFSDFGAVRVRWGRKYWSLKREGREGGKESWTGNGDGKCRVIPGQQEGPVEASGLAFGVRTLSVVLLSKAVFSSAGVVTELGRARLSNVGLCRKYMVVVGGGTWGLKVYPREA